MEREGRGRREWFKEAFGLFFLNQVVLIESPPKFAQGV